MLPRLDRLSLKPTGEFYALTPDEAAEEGEDPIHGHAFLPGQTKDSLAATFRVRSKDPRPGTTNRYVYHFFEAESLWQWVKREDRAFNPKTREPLWKEDWLALHDQFDPDSPVPHWVRNLPQLSSNFVYNGQPVLVPAWAEDLAAAFSLSSDFVEDTHGDTPVEQATDGLVQVLRQIRSRFDEQRQDNYSYHIATYDNDDNDGWDSTMGDPPPSLINVVDNLLVCVSRPDTISQRVRAAAIGFVAHFLQVPTTPASYVDAVADYVYDGDSVDHDGLRLGLDVYFMAVTNAIGTPPLVRHVTRLNALRVRHHTFWNRPILDRHLKGPPPSANPPAPMLTGYADALMVLLKEKVEAATSVMSNFTHEEDDVMGFFQLEDYAHYSVRVYATVGTELLTEVEELFRKTLTYTEEDDGRRRALIITLFANVLNVFVELLMWEDSDYGIFGAEMGDDVRDWAAKVASTLRSVVRSEDSVSTKSDPVTTFFWWYMAPLYEAGTASNQISETRLAYGPPHLDREDLMKALDLLNETISYLPADPPPVAHERPAGEATPGRRRQRTEA